VDFQKYYTLTNSIFNQTGKKVYILVGTNLRLENPILNIKLKKLSKTNSVLVAYIGPKVNSNIELIHLGSNINTLTQVITGKHPFSTVIQTFLKKNIKGNKIQNLYKNNVEILFGNDFNSIKNSNNIKFVLNNLSLNNVNFSINQLELYSGKINACELGLVNNISTAIAKNSQNINYLIDAEYKKNITEKDLTIYQGTHNEKIRTKFDFILPTLN
jgi:NADH dehydrogenase (ubiquinone) Fe-S protein 1